MNKRLHNIINGIINGSIDVNYKINKENVDKALKVLIDNGIDKDEAETVLQAIGYALIDTELETLFE